MLFQDSVFIVFLIIVFGLWALTHKWNYISKTILLIASYVFYGAWNVKYIWLILASTLIDYVVGIILSNLKQEQKLKRNLALTASIVTNLGLLGFFKYQNFFIESVNGVLPFNIPVLQTLLPVGISFYTFQSMSYTIDVYRKSLPVCKNFIDFATYVSFFPQLVAGPIVRAADFLPQLKNSRTLGIKNFSNFLPIFAVGLFKKLILADNLALFVDPVFKNFAAHSSLDCVLAVVAYAFQIYYDFSGYTDMAIGVAALFGYTLTINFNLPYIATSIADFWRRWHISLSTWLRDYLYIPLGGSKMKTSIGVARNLLITMILGGLWHGAAWNFVVWGAYQGVLLTIERFFIKPNKKENFWFSLIIRWPATMLFVLGGWLIFRVQHLKDIVVFFKTLFYGSYTSTTVPNICLLIIIGSILYTSFRFIQTKSNITINIPQNSYLHLGYGILKGALAVILIIFSLIFSCGTSNPYIYFQF